MVYNEISYFPDTIDPLIFFQDNGIEHIDALSKYLDLLKKGNYTEASTYADFQSNLNGYFGSLFNLIENRIYTWQKELLRKETLAASKGNYITSITQYMPPYDLSDSTIWISENDEPSDLKGHLYYFYTNEPTNNNISNEDIWIDCDDSMISHALSDGDISVNEPTDINIGTVWIGE